MDAFYVTASSNASSEFYPDNTLGHFYNRLAEPIHLDNPAEWEVGLTELSSTPIFSTIYTVDKEDLQINVVVKTPLHGRGVKEDKATLNLKHFRTGKEFEKQIKSAFEDPKMSAMVKQSVKVYLPGLTGVASKRFTLVLRKNTFLHMSKVLVGVLGLEKRFLTEEGVLGSAEEKVVCSGMIDYATGLHSLWVYCNCIEHRLVGDVRVPLLRNVVLRNEEDMEGWIYALFTQPYYIPVSQSHLTDLEIFITLNTGEKVSFFPGELLVTLHFRRRRRT